MASPAYTAPREEFPGAVEYLKDWLASHPAEAQLQIENARKLRVAVARDDVNEFVELIGKDEKTGGPIKQAPVHESFQALCDVHKRLIIWGHVESGKTWNVAVYRVLWELGRNPNLRIVVVSKTQGQARKIVSAVKAHVENSDELHEVFPSLRPGAKWSDVAITVAGRVGSPKDYSVEATGVGGTLMGSRIDLAILDDVLDWENTLTQERRDSVTEWHLKTISGRLSDDAREWILGNAWHPQDFLHRTAKNPAWKAYRFPVIDPETRLPRWPERWPLSRIKEWTEEWGTSEAARQLYCVPRSDEDSRIKDAWIAKCLERGDGRTMPFALKHVPLGYKTYTGVDVSTGEAKDLSCCFTICVHPNRDREVLCVESGKWDGPEIVKRIISHHQRFHSIVAVESNAAQKFITQFTGGSAPVRNFHTGTNKMSPEFGIESVFVEIERGQWIIPSAGGRPLTREVSAWIDGMRFYTPSAHTADELMACWIAREASEHRVGKVRQGAQRTLRR
jgi:hypothetical protein